MSGCAGTAELANPPRVSLAGLGLAEIGLVEQRYAARLRIQNPNDARLRVRGMEYTIYINGRKFADGVSDRNFSVAAYSERIVEVNLTSTVLRVYEQFKKLSEGFPLSHCRQLEPFRTIGKHLFQLRRRARVIGRRGSMKGRWIKRRA